MSTPNGPQHYLQKVVEASVRFQRQLLFLLATLSLVYHVALFFLPPPYDTVAFHWALSIGLTLTGLNLLLNLRGAPLPQIRGVALAIIGSWITFDMTSGILAGEGINIWMALDLLLASLLALALLPADKGLWGTLWLYLGFVVVALLAGPVDVMLLLNLLILVVVAAYLSLHGLNIAGEREQKARLLQELRFDGLTGALTRHAIECEITALLDSDRPPPALLMMLDLDHFKKVNDTYGHLMGDRVLQELAQALGQEIGANGWVGRWGGEEFLAVARVMSPAHGYDLAERIRVCVSELNSAHPTLPPLTVSIGAVMLHKATLTELVEAADALLYVAKSRGRNCVVMGMAPTQDPPSGMYAAPSLN